MSSLRNSQREYDISGLTATPIRIFRSSDDVECHDRKMSREAAAALIVGCFPTPERPVTSVVHNKDHDHVSIIVISENAQVVDHQLLIQHQQRSSANSVFPGSGSSWFHQKCCQWKRKLSRKLKRKSAHGANGDEGALGRVDMYKETEPDIETGPEVYIEVGNPVDWHML